VIGLLSGALMRLKAADRFQPDVLLAAGDDLSAYGWGATIAHDSRRATRYPRPAGVRSDRRQQRDG